MDRIIKSSDEVKLHYYFGWKVWEAWKVAKKYIINHLNPNWTDPTLLKSGYNVSSLLQLIRESTFHHEANEDARDNVRCIKKREKGKGNNNWKDVKNAIYNEKYNNKLDKLKKENWFPDAWFTFLAYGSPAKFPAPSLYTSRIKVEDNIVIHRINGKRTIQDLTIESAFDGLTPTADSDITIHSKAKKYDNENDDDDINVSGSANTSGSSFAIIRKIKKEDEGKSKKYIQQKQMVNHPINVKVPQQG